MGPGDPALCNCLPPRPKPMLVGPLSLTGTSPKFATFSEGFRNGPGKS